MNVNSSVSAKALAFALSVYSIPFDIGGIFVLSEFSRCFDLLHLVLGVLLSIHNFAVFRIWSLLLTILRWFRQYIFAEIFYGVFCVVTVLQLTAVWLGATDDSLILLFIVVLVPAQYAFKMSCSNLMILCTIFLMIGTCIFFRASSSNLLQLILHFPNNFVPEFCLLSAIQDCDLFSP